MNEREQKIYDLWQQNFSTAMIAKMMNISKNSVCGIVFRLRERGIAIPKRSSHPTGLITIRPPKPVEEKKSCSKREGYGLRFARLFDRAIATDSMVEVPKNQNVKKMGKNVRFWNLTAQSCRYVINDGRPEQFIFCGAPKERGAYCEEHAKICFMPPKVPNKEYQRANVRFK